MTNTATANKNNKLLDANSMPISWSVFQELLNDPDENFFLKKDLYNLVLVNLSADIYAETPITLGKFIDTCMLSLDAIPAYNFSDCENLTTTVVKKHNYYVRRNNASCSEIVKMEYPKMNLDTSANNLNYISKSTAAYEEYYAKLKEYNAVLTRLYHIDSSKHDNYPKECEIIKKQAYKNLLNDLVERNLYIQSLDGSKIVLYYTQTPDYHTRIDDAADEVLDKIGSEYILLDDIKCTSEVSSEITECIIEPAFGGAPFITIRVIKQMLDY